MRNHGFTTALTILTAFALVTPLLAEDASRVLRVVGRAEVFVAPDEAVLSLGATDVARTAREAQAALNTRLDAIMTAVRQAGVPANKIQTGSLNLHPDYASPEQGKTPAIRGYRASGNVTIRLDDLTLVGEVVDRATRAGANQVQGVSFTRRHDDEAKAEALSRAAGQARAKAETLARALGVELAALMEVSEAEAVVRPLASYGALEAVRSYDTPVAPGEVSVSASVQLVYAIRD